MPDRDYYSFDEVLNDLKLEEDELKRLVSAGEIRAFRDKNTMRFKAEDVARLRGARGTPEDLELDDLELELEDAVAAEPVADLGSETTIESIDLGDAPASEELVLEESSVSGEVIEIGGDAETAPEVIEVAPARPARPAGGARKAAKAAAAPAEPVEAITEGGAMLALMMVGAVLLIVANFLVLDAAVGRASSAVTRAVANWFS
ncbi:MAG TPA: hypothetical protein VMV01_04250 [Planctomycetota bacterium]|nr:hypothetical protein [Planctomycetota bacterium]